jgi:hypothetical protein
MCPVKRWAIQGDRSWILPAPDEHELLEIPVPSPHTFGLDDYFFRESEVLPGVLRLSSLLPSSGNPFVFERILPAGTSPCVAIAYRSPLVSGRSGHNPTKLARESTYAQTTLVPCL